jgi:hypothetical protein
MENYFYKSANTLAKTTRFFLLIFAIIDVLFVLIKIFEYFTFDLNIPKAENSLNYLIYILFIAFVSLGVFFLSFFIPIIFLIWQYRTAKNLKFINVNAISNSPGWNLGWWFIPFASLVMPFVCINELLNGNFSKNALDKNYLATSSSNSTTQLWWGLYLLSGFIGILNVFLFFQIAKKPEIITYLIITLIFSHSFQIIAALLIRSVILTINNAQEESYKLYCESNSLLKPPQPPTFE